LLQLIYIIIVSNIFFKKVLSQNIFDNGRKMHGICGADGINGTGERQYRRYRF
jgi:hypothetical protein